MKIIIYIILIIVSTNLFSQNKLFEKYIQEKLPVMAKQLSENEQFIVIIEFLKRYYGKSFKYYNEIRNGLYVFTKDKTNPSNYFLSFLSLDKNILDKLKLKKIKNELGNYDIIFDYKDISEFLKPVQNANYTSNKLVSTVEIVLKNNMLYDQMILYNEDLDPEYWRILNRNFTTEFFVNQYDEPSVLFKLLEAGVIIPWGNNGASSKLLTIDSKFESIIYFDPEVFNMGEILPLNKAYGRGGWGYGEFSSPTGIARGRKYSSGNYLHIPVYVADQYNFRIISVVLKINEVSQELAYIEDNSFWEVAHPLWPYDISYFQDVADSSSDKLWISGADPLFPQITCFSVNGNKLQEFIGYLDTNTNQTYLFEEGTKSRICVFNHEYPGFAALAFVDNVRNYLVGCPLNPDGTARVIQYGDGYLIVAHEVLSFPQNEQINSVNFQATGGSNYSYAWPTLWVTSDNSIHNLKMNSTAHIQYICSSNCPLNTCPYAPSFHNLRNTIVAHDYYDISTVEQWSNEYGVRRYRTFVDIFNDTLIGYCNDSTDQLKFQATYTNDCWAYFKAYRLNRNGNWELMKIDKLNGVPVNDTFKTKFEYAGWSGAWEDQDLRIKLDLPIEDYALGGQVKLFLTLFPEYNGVNFHNPHVTKAYTADIKKTCLPPAGGCPFLYVTDTNIDYIADNNILHRSEFGGEGDITDKYKLRIVPYTANNEIELSLVENENDNGYINMVKLYAVDYHSSKKMAITEDNQIVLYDSATVLASDSVTLNSTNITSRVNFHNPDTIHVVGYTNNEMYAHFTNPDMKTGLRNARNKLPLIKGERGMDELIPRNRQKSDNNDRRETKERSLPLTPSLRGNSKTNGERPEPVAFIADLSNLKYPEPGAKYYAGELTATSIFSNQVQKQFARRELSSVMVLPLFADTDKVDNINIAWQSDFQMKYLGVTNNLLYEGYTSTEAPIMEGKYITANDESNITENLMYIDENYGTVSSSGLIKMKFDIRNIPALPENYVRDYVIEVNGRYYRGDDSRLSNVKPHEVPLTFKLSQNYPNPFNPVTKIKFEIPKTSKVNLVIYNILGQEVKILVNSEIKEAGRYEVVFDMTNFASGVYFYRIEAGSFVQAKKMVLVK